MPKLLNINSYHYRRGGADAVYFDHASLMGDLGWENAYWAMHHPNNQPSAWSDYFVDEIEFGNAYSLPDKMLKASKVVWSFEAQRKLERLLNDFKPDIAHLHNIYHHLSPSILSTLKKAGIPVVLTAHDLKLACPSYSMYTDGKVCERCKSGNYLNTIRQRCVQGSLAASAVVSVEAFAHRWLGSYRRHVDRIVVPSHFFQEKFVEWGWSNEKFAHIANWVNAENFEPNFQPGQHFLYFGRVDATKGIETLIKASAQAGVPLKIAGRGPLEPQAKALAQSLNHPVEFLGFRSGQDLYDQIRAARAVVLPAEWYENAPISVLEAFALGKPVIGSEIGGIPEMVQHELNGWTFPAYDVNALAERLSMAAQMPDQAIETVGRAAREFVLSRFSQDRYAQQMTTLYNSLLS